jgi:hypothetical protein
MPIEPFVFQTRISVPNDPRGDPMSQITNANVSLAMEEKTIDMNARDAAKLTRSAENETVSPKEIAKLEIQVEPN